MAVGVAVVWLMKICEILQNVSKLTNDDESVVLFLIKVLSLIQHGM